MAYTIKLNQEQVDKVHFMLRDIKNGVETAQVRAINKGVDKAVSLSAKGISDKVTLTQKRIKENIKKAKASRYQIGGSVVISSRRIPFIDYKHSVLKRGGINVKVFRDQPAVHFRSVFIATMPSGHRGIFQRRGKARLPIVEMMGPFLSSVYSNTPGLAEQVEGESAGVVIAELDRQIQYLLEKHKNA